MDTLYNSGQSQTSGNPEVELTFFIPHMLKKIVKQLTHFPFGQAQYFLELALPQHF